MPLYPFIPKKPKESEWNLVENIQGADIGYFLSQKTACKARLVLLYHQGDKQAYSPPDGKQLPQPMDTSNIGAMVNSAE